MPNEKHPIPRTDKERRRRILQMLRVDAGEIDAPDSAVPTKPTTQGQRKRIVEAMAAEMGLPRPTWRKSNAASDASIATPYGVSQVDVEARFAAQGLRMDRHGRVRCDDCDKVIATIPRGAVAFGTSPTALRLWHASRGCV